MAIRDSSPVCVIGLGQIGGSVVKAAAEAGREVFGYVRSARTFDAARAAGFTVFGELESALKHAELRRAVIVVAVPLPATGGVFARIAAFGGSCVVTDVGSVKAPILAAAEEHGLGGRFVGGHPMAGSANSGWAAADAALFHGAAWVVSVDEAVTAAGFAEVARLALGLGAVVVPALAAEHDRAVARISHLPHLLAAVLANTGAAGGELALGLAAGSFRDGTRVAGSDPALAEAMCANNTAAVIEALDEALDALNAARTKLGLTGLPGPVVRSGRESRAAYDRIAAQRPVIAGVDLEEPDWRERLAEAGRRGAILRRL
ncbi:Prephenate dehydrogenase [Segniliparus rotundus DSM 44985]|uniref:Prephenate dehydrogenase n=1 Tax=Segniliparus rotundus (strain ATCC BAA-972 / CDC 1076 / CIP 108378 / DSM 44985 / JCM 13578) TaxID=640132 RepID=D6ZCI2_SEGRD|nr:prephenate dehydrogenase [Segniliparus rotundus]ADG97024.1 Prephenate dehydrogenase [Segniliparus rotundus DSM 44985]